MRAVVYAGLGRVEVTDVPDPVLKDPADAIVQVERAAVCGTDLHLIADGEHLPAGFVLGHEFTGRVVDAGAGVSAHRVGDRVAGGDFTACGTCWWCRRGDHWECPRRQFFGTGTSFGPELAGAQAQLVRVPFADAALRPVPEEISADAAVFLGDTLATAHAAVQRAGLRPGDTTVVVGGGPVGQLTSLAAQACGAGTVVLVEPVEARRAAAAAEGALTAAPENARELVERVTAGRGADVVVDAIGGAPGLDTAFGLVRRRGTIVSVGLPAKSWPLPAGQAFADELTLRFVIGDFLRDGDDILALVRAGAIDPAVVASATVLLADAPDAYRQMAERRTLKALIRL
ncbi:alcohol dehydrogenase catalytic domain-containing protein [Amycolatopsis rubida]|uniref:Alcohol dehydrogenase catalytic domain-containing protein n=1 Tax=Amycolatopsis rubida TaxID=112413 RepID=A0A1I5VGL1_9PSEU|nr:MULTISPECIES: alcohol dehydrogenase catalytic domain-containing protein [Amycolatopsis]MYW89326.1 alcohol dehydrogenase catalytic domain-containing protein [Amycolatopsis rubida]NEC54304.1 alcohol dehydrogenase catalytic domain-containing protein [Amycolatopsis rubida]OAP21075.1 D-arabitol-phosphate dehydrogenase [Amycolatopsis sp. M39]SFQ06645.1 Threonine dehydrogenase [Amycolatopsis rubida]